MVFALVRTLDCNFFATRELNEATVVVLVSQYILTVILVGVGNAQLNSSPTSKTNPDSMMVQFSPGPCGDNR
jgi:hypothetical protein